MIDLSFSDSLSLRKEGEGWVLSVNQMLHFAELKLIIIFRIPSHIFKAHRLVVVIEIATRTIEEIRRTE